MKLRNTAFETIMFTFFIMLLLAFIIKALVGSYSEDDVPVAPIDKTEIMKHNFDEPDDYAKDSTLSLQQLRVYEHWYDQK